MKNGIVLDRKREASLVSWAIYRPRPPRQVQIPLRWQNDLAAIPCVTPGQSVRLGQKIADPAGAFNVAVHASISGTVVAITQAEHPFLGKVPAVILESDDQMRKTKEFGCKREGWKNLSTQEIRDILQNAGVVGLQSMAPVHHKNGPEKQGRAHTLILNACESEPYVTSDHALILSHPMEILKGAEILRMLSGAERVWIVLEGDQLAAVEILRSKIYLSKWNHFEVRTVPARYPQGHAVTLIETLLGAGALEQKQKPIAETVRMHHVATAFAVYEAVALQKPLVERAVTIGGECVAEAKNVWVPLGTSYDESFKFCRGLLREPRKVITGGPMTGRAQPHLDFPVLPGTQALLALPKEIVFEEEVSPCIRCSACTDACPVEISPAMIALAAERDRFDLAQDWGAALCIECGACSYVCPAKRPMVELIRYADSRYAPEEKVEVPRKPFPKPAKEPQEKKFFAETF